MFHVGQKVVCVDDRIYGVREWVGDMVRKGAIYHIRAIDTEDYPEGEYAVLLHEIVHDPDPEFGCEIGFVPSRFRPIQTTDISIFTKMLNTTPVNEKVEG